MRKIFKVLVAAILGVAVIGSLSACASAEPLDMSSVAAVIDVRTPAEFAEGHLEGALNFDIQGPNFASELSTLDKASDYVIYCRSGNRAGQAVTQMQSAGFTGDLTNAGSVDAAAGVTGLAIVR